MPCDRRTRHRFVSTICNCSTRWSISLPLENTWETDGRYHAQLLAKRGDDTHGELTNKACHVSPTCEPRGLDGAWGPARFARSRGWHGPGTAVVCASYYQPLVLVGLQSAPQPRGSNIVPAVPVSHPDINTPPRNSQFNPAQYSFCFLHSQLWLIDKKRALKRTRNAEHTRAPPVPSCIRI
jgi:hypothetical protein